MRISSLSSSFASSPNHLGLRLRQMLVDLLMPHLLPSVVLPSTNKPVDDYDEDHHAIDSTDVVHVCMIIGIKISEGFSFVNALVCPEKKRVFRRWDIFCSEKRGEK